MKMASNPTTKGHVHGEICWSERKFNTHEPALNDIGPNKRQRRKQKTDTQPPPRAFMQQPSNKWHCVHGNHAQEQT